MENGASITVAHGSKIIHAVALKLAPGEGWWWSGEGLSGPLGDEGIHYVRGFLRTWWPPHRKRADALIVAAALGPAPTEPEHTISPANSEAPDGLYVSQLKQ